MIKIFSLCVFVFLCLLYISLLLIYYDLRYEKINKKYKLLISGFNAMPMAFALFLENKEEEKTLKNFTNLFSNDIFKLLCKNKCNTLEELP